MDQNKLVQMIKSLGVQRLEETRGYGASLRMAGRHKMRVKNKLAEEDSDKKPTGRTDTGQKPTEVVFNPEQQNPQVRAPEGSKPPDRFKV